MRTDCHGCKALRCISPNPRAKDISTVATCSALKRVYRDVIRAAAPGTFFLHLSAPFEVLEERMHSRAGHFMPSSLLQSQFAALEPLGRGECGALLT